MKSHLWYSGEPKNPSPFFNLLLCLYSPSSPNHLSNRHLFLSHRLRFAHRLLLAPKPIIENHLVAISLTHQHLLFSPILGFTC